MPEPRRLRQDPDWGAAAQLLIDGCAHASGPAARVDLLERLCLALGDELYPAFLTVLVRVGERGTPAARSAVAEALVDALRSGRLPAGRRAAWGAAPGGGVRGAALGPLEYLCAWYTEPQGADAPSATRFERALSPLLAVVAASARAHALYVSRLRALADDPLDGTLTRSARQALRALADAWQRPDTAPPAVADAVLQALGAGSGLQRFGPAPVR